MPDALACQNATTPPMTGIANGTIGQTRACSPACCACASLPQAMVEPATLAMEAPMPETAAARALKGASTTASAAKRTPRDNAGNISGSSPRQMVAVWTNSEGGDPTADNRHNATATRLDRPTITFARMFAGTTGASGFGSTLRRSPV